MDEHRNLFVLAIKQSFPSSSGAIRIFPNNYYFQLSSPQTVAVYFHPRRSNYVSFHVLLPVLFLISFFYVSTFLILSFLISLISQFLKCSSFINFSFHTTHTWVLNLYIMSSIVKLTLNWNVVSSPLIASFFPIFSSRELLNVAWRPTI